MISVAAWRHVTDLHIAPRMVFVHPVLLQDHPNASLYYRGIALLSQKQVGQMASSVSGWEDGSIRRPVADDRALRVARLYNAVISTIIEGATGWTLENGYRNILATMGIRLDGMYRNHVGKLAEQLVKTRIADWVRSQGLVESEPAVGTFELVAGVTMRFSAEPDIEFRRDSALVATVEIKGGKDPAGALERLGAMQKSFEETPAGCENFLIAGVVTPEMSDRLGRIGVTYTFLLDDISQDGREWEEFTKELFHYSLRVV